MPQDMRLRHLISSALGFAPGVSGGDGGGWMCSAKDAVASMMIHLRTALRRRGMLVRVLVC